MAEMRRGLGRGLDALLGGANPDRHDPEVRMLAVAAISPNPNQPRRTFDQAALDDLTRSVKEHGVLQPILVRPMPGRSGSYELVAGERRWRASKAAGLAEIPALVKELGDEDSLAIALIENLQREDLNPMEAALGYRELIERFGLSQESLATRVGKSRPAVANTLRLLQLPEAIQEDLFEGRLSAGHARAILAVPEPTAQAELRRRILEHGHSVRQVEEQAGHFKRHQCLPDLSGRLAAAPNRPRRERRPLSDRLQSVQSDLSARLDTAVKVQGNETRGTISIHFASAEELDRLLGCIAAGRGEA